MASVTPSSASHFAGNVETSCSRRNASISTRCRRASVPQKEAPGARRSPQVFLLVFIRRTESSHLHLVSLDHSIRRVTFPHTGPTGELLLRLVRPPRICRAVWVMP